MRYIQLFVILISVISLSSCSTTKSAPENNDLLEFAKSNCFFWYFKSQNIDTRDIKKITSGIVEMSTYSANKFQQVAFLVKDYSPKISSKNNINNNLQKCFILDSDKEFLAKLDVISEL